MGFAPGSRHRFRGLWLAGLLMAAGWFALLLAAASILEALKQEHLQDAFGIIWGIPGVPNGDLATAGPLFC